MRQINATLGRSILEPDRNFYPVGAVGWMRFAIKLAKGRKLRIVVYARISTDEQRVQSLAAQIMFCRKALLDMSLTLDQFEIRVIEDDGISGEIVSRPGIDEVNRLIRARKVDLIVAEDASRLYRIENPCFQLVESAIELGARVICVRDRVDSAEEGVWGTRLHEAMQQHGRANEYTRYRINRTMEELWLTGAAVTKRKSGYRRIPTIPSTVDRPASGPWFDEVDPAWTEVSIEAFQRAAVGETGREIAEYLTMVGLPRQGNKSSTKWNAKAVLAFIRDPIRRGHEQFRCTHSRRPWAGGKATVQRSEKEKIWHRDMPHLRTITDSLWFAANDAIDQRRSTNNRSCGVDNPLYGVPRDSRSPVASLLICRCGAKMHNADSGRYRCSRSLWSVPVNERCWNAASADCAMTHSAIALAIREHAEQVTSQFDTGLQALRELLKDDSDDESMAQRLVDEIAHLEASALNLTRIGERAKEPIESVAARLVEIQDRLDRARARLEDLQEHRAELELPTTPEFVNSLDELCARLEQGDRHVKQNLRLVASRIAAIPHQQCSGNLVVLRARFELKLIGLLPAQVRLSIESRNDAWRLRLPECFQPVTLAADLFKSSTGPKHGVEACRLADEGLGPTAIGKRLGISKRQACIATDYGRAMKAIGRSDPYIELNEPPQGASRWRPNGRKSRQND